MAGTDTRPYLNGKKVYDGVSHSPNRGATSKPQGYVQRELKKRSTGGESRSGKAEAFLQVKDRMQQDQQPQQPPVIAHTFMPMGTSGLMKDETGRLYYGDSAQAQASEAEAAQAAAEPDSPAI